MTEKRPPVPCTWCKEPNCNDWMYHAGLVPATEAICGKCKIEFGEKMKKELGEKNFNLFLQAHGVNTNEN